MMNDREFLKWFTRLAANFRATPIFDKYFEQQRDRFDSALTTAERFVAEPKPTIVCLCGSTRFYKEFQEANYKETLAGKIVLTVGFFAHISKKRMTIDGCMGEQEVTVDVISQHDELKGCTPEQKKELDILHLRKIDLADEVLILNVGGYIGESTRRELAYAEQQNKKIRFLDYTEI